MTVVDGHNLYHALDRVDEAHFEAGLDRLLAEIREGLNRGRVLLVFDGTGGLYPRGHEARLNEHLTRVYSGSISADDWILGWAQRMKLPSFELVSNDLKLFKQLKPYGAKRLDPQRWFRTLKSPSPRRTKGEFGTVDEWLDYFGEEP